MDKENFLLKAKEFFPIGTVYKCASKHWPDRTHTVENQNFIFIDKNTIWGEHGKGCLYKDGVWAEIIIESTKALKVHKPNEEIKYEIY